MQQGIELILQQDVAKSNSRPQIDSVRTCLSRKQYGPLVQTWIRKFLSAYIVRTLIIFHIFEQDSHVWWLHSVIISRLLVNLSGPSVKCWWELLLLSCFQTWTLEDVRRIVSNFLQSVSFTHEQQNRRFSFQTCSQLHRNLWSVVVQQTGAGCDVLIPLHIYTGVGPYHQKLYWCLSLWLLHVWLCFFLFWEICICFGFSFFSLGQSHARNILSMSSPFNPGSSTVQLYCPCIALFFISGYFFTVSGQVCCFLCTVHPELHILRNSMFCCRLLLALNTVNLSILPIFRNPFQVCRKLECLSMYWMRERGMGMCTRNKGHQSMTGLNVYWLTFSWK